MDVENEEADEQILPDGTLDAIINDLAKTDNSGLPKLPFEPAMNKSVEAVASNTEEIVAKEPAAIASSSKSITVNSADRGIKEFIRILRPNLPREAKSRACKLLKKITTGVSRTNASRQRLRKKTSSKVIRKREARNLKKKFTRVLSLCESDSGNSEMPCRRCAYYSYRIARY